MIIGLGGGGGGGVWKWEKPTILQNVLEWKNSQIKNVTYQFNTINVLFKIFTTSKLSKGLRKVPNVN